MSDVLVHANGTHSVVVNGRRWPFNGRRLHSLDGADEFVDAHSSTLRQGHELPTRFVAARSVQTSDEFLFDCSSKELCAKLETLSVEGLHQHVSLGTRCLILMGIFFFGTLLFNG